MNELSGTLAATLVSLTQAAILCAGVVDDLRSRKFHNWLFLTCCGVALVVVLIAQGWTALYLSALGFGAGIVVLLPLVLLKMVGAGDMKLMAAFGIVAGWNTVVDVAILALVWGAIFGVVRIVIDGQLKVLASNMMSIVTMKKQEGIQLHQIPYSVALFVGWLSHLVYQGLI
jgi:prepilin peptidase CpaA